MPRESVSDPRIGGQRQTQEKKQKRRPIDAAVADLARRQHGVAGRSQLLALGMSRRGIERRLEGGRLHLLHPAVYAVGHRLIPKQGQWMAAVLASGPEAALSHRSAAALWKLRGYSGGAIHVTVPHKSTSTKRIRRHFSVVPEDERAVEDGIPVTSVHRTIFDLAASEDVDAVVAMIKEAEYLNRWDRLSLPDLLGRYPSKRGARNIRFALQRLTEEPPGRKLSKLEERFGPFLRRHRLPPPRFNDWIAVDGKNYRVDCHWLGTNQIVELDGWQGHHTRSAFRDDRERDRRLTAAGHTITHITWGQLDDEPEAIAADLRAILNRNEAPRAGPHHPPPGK